MRRIKLDFGRYGDAALLVLVQAIFAALTGNPFFPSPNPTLANFKTFIDAYAAALSAAQDRGKNSVAAKNARKLELVNLLFNLALDTMQTADGDEEKLVSSGFPLTKIRGPKQPLGIPFILKVEVGANSGELHITIEFLPGARTFVIQYSEDPLSETSEWISLNTTRTKATITGLETGKRYRIRIVAYGTDNQMTVSDPVLSKIVQ